jgi:hypothetical protein
MVAEPKEHLEETRQVTVNMIGETMDAFRGERWDLDLRLSREPGWVLVRNLAERQSRPTSRGVLVFLRGHRNSGYELKRRYGPVLSKEDLDSIGQSMYQDCIVAISCENLHLSEIRQHYQMVSEVAVEVDSKLAIDALVAERDLSANEIVVLALHDGDPLFIFYPA